MVCIPLAVVCYLIASTPIAGAPTTSPAELREALVKTAFYAVIATLVVAPLALNDRGWYARMMASWPMVFLGEISYEIFLIHLVTMEFVMVEVLRLPDLHRVDVLVVRGDAGRDDPAGLAAAPVHPGPYLAPGAKSSARTTRFRANRRRLRLTGPRDATVVNPSGRVGWA